MIVFYTTPLRWTYSEYFLCVIIEAEMSHCSNSVFFSFNLHEINYLRLTKLLPPLTINWSLHQEADNLIPGGFSCEYFCGEIWLWGDPRTIILKILSVQIQINKAACTGKSFDKINLTFVPMEGGGGGWPKHSTLTCHFMSFNVSSCHFMSFHVMSHHITCHVPCNVKLYHVIFHIMSYISCYIMSWVSCYGMLWNMLCVMLHDVSYIMSCITSVSHIIYHMTCVILYITYHVLHII